MDRLRPYLRVLLELGPMAGFLILGGLVLVNADWTGLGGDGLLYRGAASAWLAGGDPWLAGREWAHFAGSPTVLLAFVPFTALPDSIFVALWIPTLFLCATYTVRKLRLPWYWLAFGPLLDGIQKGNPTIAMFALLVAGSSVMGAAAAAIKIIAIPPLLGEARWRALIWYAVLTLASFAVAPGLWHTYVSELPTIATRLASELGEAPTVLTIPTAAALLLLGWRRVGWLAVPVAWPAFEYHYGVLTMPLANPWLALAAALPWREGIQLAVIAAGTLAAWRHFSKPTDPAQVFVDGRG